MAEFRDHLRQFQQVANALKKIERPPLSESEHLDLLTAALDALSAVDVEKTKSELIGLQSALQKQLAARLASRRQDLEQHARKANVPYRRLSNADMVDVFSVEYSNLKVKLSIGSEELAAFEEADGEKLFQQILSQREALDRMLVPRERFFRTLKTSIAMARAEGKVAEGKVKIKELFPYVAAARQLASDAFRKKPSAKLFVNYTTAMLCYELHQFGDHKDGWECGSERLCNRGPAMSTQQEALVLPDASGNPIQVLWVWIE